MFLQRPSRGRTLWKTILSCGTARILAGLATDATTTVFDEIMTTPHPSDPHLDYIFDLASKIGERLDGELGSNAFLALLLTLQFVLEKKIMSRNLGDGRETIQEFYELIPKAYRVGADLLVKDIKHPD